MPLDRPSPRRTVRNGAAPDSPPLTPALPALPTPAVGARGVDTNGGHGPHSSMRTRRLLSVSILALLCAFPVLAFAQSGRVVGIVTDAGTGGPMPGANVRIQGTTIGAATDLNGRFVLPGVPAGEQTVVASFVGYNSDSTQVVVRPGEEVEVDLALSWLAAETGEVVVTAQARGQLQAINEQLTAETITNVVSAERIRELPDESAAAAVSRLPGVSLQNGDQIVVRGIEAKYNTVTVNGVQLPSTTTDRSTSLGFISANMLAGIEVAKSVTPAMDANSIGGNINLRLREAPEDLHYDTMIQWDYNDQDNTSDNYRAWASVSNRFLDDRVGVFAQGNARRFNGGGDVSSAGFGEIDPQNGVEDVQTYYINTFDFQDQVNINEEYGGSLLLDLRLPSGKIILQNAYSSESFNNATFTDRLNLQDGTRVLGFGVPFGGPGRTIGDRYLLVNSLQGDHQLAGLGNLGVNWSLSHARSRREDDLSYNVTFSGTGWFDPISATDAVDIDPVFDIEYLEGADAGVGAADVVYESFGERRLVGSLDLTLPVEAGFISGRLQGGGKYSDLDRDRDRTSFYRRLTDADNNAGAADFIRGLGGDPNAPLLFSIFQDPDYERGAYYLDGRRPFNENLDVELMDEYFRLAQTAWPGESLAGSSRFDYTAQEQVAAGYIMGNFDLGRYLNLLGGVRYENYSFNNSAPFVNQTLYDGAGAVVDTLTAERSMGHWFPNIQAQVSPTDWFDIRLAYTKTTSRPDYQYLLANSFANQGSSGQSGNPNLRPTISDNYDAYFSVHNNRIGLFTFGVFAKELSDIIRPLTFQYRNIGLFEGTYWAGRDVGYPVCEDGRARTSCEDTNGDGRPDGLAIPVVNPTGDFQTFVNNPDSGLLRGFEIDWQTNFWYLPRPFNSVVFNVNYTRIDSEVDYQSITRIPGEGPFDPLQEISSVRPGRLYQQGNNVVNVALGADIGGFSGRVSFRYQDDILVSLDSVTPDLDVFTAPNYSWDFSLRQNLPIDGLSLFLNGVNITHAVNENNRVLAVGATSAVRSEITNGIAYYPNRYQLGIRYGL